MESIFDEEKKVEGLSNKVAELIRRYTEAREENEKMRDEDLSKQIDDILAGDNLGEK